jgi:hypothetical protein
MQILEISFRKSRSYPGRRSRGRLDTCPLWQACLAHWPEHPKNSGLDISRALCACQTRRVATSSRPVPKISGETRRSFISSNSCRSLALARARKLEQFRVRQCRSGGLQNNKIVPEKRNFHKVIMGPQLPITVNKSISYELLRRTSESELACGIKCRDISNYSVISEGLRSKTEAKKDRGGFKFAWALRRSGSA